MTYTTRIHSIKALIADNSSLFRENNQIPESTLCALFALQPPTLTGNRHADTKLLAHFHLKKLTIYTSINRVMAEEGLYIKQEHCGNSYRVLTLDETIAETRRYEKESTTKRKAAFRLRTGTTIARQTGKWKQETF